MCTVSLTISLPGLVQWFKHHSNARRVLVGLTLQSCTAVRFHFEKLTLSNCSDLKVAKAILKAIIAPEVSDAAIVCVSAMALSGYFVLLDVK